MSITKNGYSKQDNESGEDDDRSSKQKLQKIENLIIECFKDDSPQYRSNASIKYGAVRMVKSLIKRLKLMQWVLDPVEKPEKLKLCLKILAEASQDKDQNSGLANEKQRSKYDPQVKQLSSKLQQQALKVKKQYQSKVIELQSRLKVEYQRKIKQIEQRIQSEQQNKLKVKEAQIIDQYEKKWKNVVKKQSGPYSPEKEVHLGQLLRQQEDYREFVLQILEKATHQQPKFTKLLYRMDQLNSVNFHKYIDHHPNLLLIVKLKNGYMLGAYQEQAIKENIASSKLGLIFSLTNRKCFKNINKSFSYDASHLLYGNSELRILHGKNKIYSNFGVGNSYYQKHNYDVDILLGEGKNRETEMAHYQIMQVVFK